MPCSPRPTIVVLDKPYISGPMKRDRESFSEDNTYQFSNKRVCQFNSMEFG